MTVGNADDACEPQGLLMLCINTLHESSVSIPNEKIEFLAYAWGVDLEISEGITIPTGGSCWAEGYLGGTYNQDCDCAKIKVTAECVLDGKVSASAAIVNFKGYIHLVGDSSKNVLSTQDATYNNETLSLTTEFDNVSTGNHEIRVKFRGEATAVGEGNSAATEFNDHYGDGYFIKVKKITIECEEVSSSSSSSLSSGCSSGSS
jgi:hypothetical protein